MLLKRLTLHPDIWTNHFKHNRQYRKSQIYPSELQLDKANTSDTEAAFLELHLPISNDIVSTKIYDKPDDFDFEIVNFPFLDGDVPRSTSYEVYISQQSLDISAHNNFGPKFCFCC